jgi:hypothetical protein
MNNFFGFMGAHSLNGVIKPVGSNKESALDALADFQQALAACDKDERALVLNKLSRTIPEWQW